TQGVHGAHQAEGDPSIFRWDIAAQDFIPFPLRDEEALPTEGLYAFVADHGRGFVANRWPKQFPVGEGHQMASFRTYEQTLALQEQQALAILANPYPFPISAQALMATVPELQKISTWLPNQQRFVDILPHAIDPNFAIQPFEAFWVEAKEPIRVQWSPSLSIFWSSEESANYAKQPPHSGR
ncbi:hypothetical protein RZS08_06725, partial [Arthrospira platensis SPKY1]|nr:hypothetical protein [Arthrospira platensis SPKY1]